MIKERPVVFGTGVQLVGIITEPNPEIPPRDLPAVILWNAGLLHRVGPYRLFVDIARRLAKAGFQSLRFDLSGKGDSGTRKEGLERERALSDIRDAMDFLANGKRRRGFVLIGSCSGADEAFPVAVADKRVVGLVMLDSFGYRTLGYYFHHYAPRILRPDVWLRFFRRKIGSILSKASTDRSSPFQRGRIFVREFPPKAKVTAELKQLVDRRVQFLAIFSGGVPIYYNYRNQFRDMFRSIDFNDALEVAFFKEADHIYSQLKERERLMDCIVEWFKSHNFVSDLTRSG